MASLSPSAGAGALGSLAGATPWGAAIGAIGGIATSAIASDAVPITSGGGSTQIGGMTIGSKTVGSGSTGGTSTAQSQTPAPAPGDAGSGYGYGTSTAAGNNAWLPIAIIGAAALLAVAIALGSRRS